MDLSNKSKDQLLLLCEQYGITKCKSKNKSQLIQLLQENIKSTLSNKEKEKDNSNIQSFSSFKFIDLFCGIGGFHQALKNLNGQCVFASDIDEACRRIYQKNYNIIPEGDITKIKVENIPSFDVLCGGFPCQPFSKAGFQKGFDDERGNLFFNICDIVKHHNPKYIILENVRNLTSHDDGNTWNVIYNKIIELGYNTYQTPIILNALHFNVPQNRERVVILCKRKDLGELPLLPEIDKHPKTKLTRFIKDIILQDNAQTNKYKINGKMKDVETIWNQFIHILNDNNISIPKFPIWTDWWDNVLDSKDPFYIKYKSWINKNQEFYNENFDLLEDWLRTSRKNVNWFGAVRKFEWQGGDLQKHEDLSNYLWSARGSGIRVKKCDYIPTLVAMSMIPIYGPQQRKLCPRELLRLQSFPDDFQIEEKHIYKQIGNSVNVTMIERCARFLIFNESLFE